MSSPEGSSLGEPSSAPFAVQKGRGVPTLSSLGSNRGGSPPTAAAAAAADAGSNKEQLNTDTKSDERGESEENGGGRSDVFQQMRNIPVAGRPSDAPRRASAFAGSSSSSSGGGGVVGVGGRRSRRNSVDENASQLSLENLGGSQDNLHLLGRNPDKEMRTHVGRKQQQQQQQPEQNGGRFIDNRELEEMEKHAREGSPFGGKQQQQFVDMEKATSTPAAAADKVSFADLRRQKARDQVGKIVV